MPYRLFQYSIPSPPDLDDLNIFLASNRVLSVSQQFVPSQGGTWLVFVVQTVSAVSTKGSGTNSATKIDYRELLNPSDFAIFNRLRQERKKWSDAEGVPAYVVFTNEQLATMVRQKVNTRENLAKIQGVGTARIERHSDEILAIIASATKSANDKIDETDRNPF